MDNGRGQEEKVKNCQGQASPPPPNDDSKRAVDLIRKRRPKAEAVTISNPKEGSSYVEIMKKVMADVNLDEIGVKVERTRRTMSGAILLEVQDKDKADLLAERLSTSIGDMASVSRPTKLTKALVVNYITHGRQLCTRRGKLLRPSLRIIRRRIGTPDSHQQWKHLCSQPSSRMEHQEDELGDVQARPPTI